MAQKVYNIGVEVTMDTIGGKWKTIILCNLRHGDKRPSELQHLIPNISQKMLTQELKELVHDNIVDRTVYNQVPPKVVYSLSDYGQSLGTILHELCAWGTMHAHTLKDEGKDIVLMEEEQLVTKG
ncbi:winged helix-turn-helix transcriptional regulator [Levilactobacillus namurensis]|uniref:winged helix-turn-helix transcriptional regulator n=1 Tax=Levilactobacillus namurensis TaxID=380393 RepID=UPI00222FEDD3|nr:helix-turn-helix domain-containing protein [Levilactobacillus namurensis]MCW3779346.1 helix-turn-helix transcriptional regulator [Levilactobacillus namurensis]MDT7017656.1 helix-turn-helix domain-containing protein [Levilactobacillus namurensis]WNN65342.1 helix-turn-helix domain-containing protein [Levilactobacillus namurensis]